MTKLIDITIGVSGEPAMHRKLGLVADLIGDLTQTWKEVVHPFMLEHMKKQFATSGSHGGRKWAGYSTEPKYAAFKRRMVGHLDVLRWQKGGPWEMLFPSLTDPLHVHHVFEAKPAAVTFGTSVPHAERLTRGGQGPFEERYPGRQVIAMRSSQKKALITAIQRDLVKRFGADAVREARFV